MRPIRIAPIAVALALALVAVAVTMLWTAPREAGLDEPPRSSLEQPSPAPDDAAPLYDIEYPFIGYATTARSDRVAELERRMRAGDVHLELREPRGYLDSLLEALDVDPSSQVLVFSTTSLQTGSIRASRPRAIYFNDDVYVAWVQGGGPIEIASMDPVLGPVFYMLEHEAPAELEDQIGRCLRCHDSYSMTGGGVPRFLVGSGYIGALGNIVTHEGWILTTQRTPLRNRFGGWYVTGRHGDQPHLGNVVVRNVADLQNLDDLRIGNLDSLDGLVDTSLYIEPGSDIVALLVLQHQIDVQNAISRVNYKVRAALHEAGADDGGAVPATLAPQIAELAEPLVDAMLFVGETPLTSRISGNAAFRQRFEARGPFDSDGRSLRELDLERRLMRRPLSYLVYSAAFDQLPALAKALVYRRFADVLHGLDRSEKFEHLSDEMRAEILAILTATKPDFAAAVDAAAPFEIAAVHAVTPEAARESLREPM